MRIHPSTKGRLATVVTLALFTTAGVSLAAQGPPTWAYGTQDLPASTAPTGPPAPATGVEHIEGAASSFTRAQIGDRFGPADWFPGDHPEMPDIVAHGRKPEVWACSLCHYPNGKGRPENAAVSGLPVSYFIHQMQDFRDGLRASADPRKKNTNLMIAYAKSMSDAEIRSAAKYFGAMKWSPWIKVVETGTVPKTRLSVGMYLPLEGAAREPIGQRIIEVPQNPDATEILRDPRSGFIAYVPIGSLSRGKALVMNASRKALPCGVCHGTDLNGLGPVPGIAGRSPSYLVRQLYDMQQDTRKGEWTQLMKPVVGKLSQEDMLNIAAYVSSLPPGVQHN